MHLGLRLFTGVAVLLGQLGCMGATLRDGSTGARDEQDHDASPASRPANADPPVARTARRAPAVGEAAPDFTLNSPDGALTVSRSKFHADRPRVLVFGSFT